MNRIIVVVREIYGLVVDDGVLALAVVAWTALIWLLVARLGLSPSWGAAGLWVGLAAVLMESALRRARR